MTHIPNWNGLRALLEKEDFIYIADCKLNSNKNLTTISSNGGFFITIVPIKTKEAMLFLYFIALMIVSLIERKIRINMSSEKIEKLPILPQAMNTKKPTWNNIRYFYRNVHYSQIFRNGVCIQAVVKGISALHERINRLLEIPNAVYKSLQDGWWQFKAT